MNLFEGGKHAKNHLAFQEYHIVPDIDYVNEAVEIGIKIQKYFERNDNERVRRRVCCFGR